MVAFARRSRAQPRAKKPKNERNKRQTAAVAGQESLSLMPEMISNAGNMLSTAKHKPKRVQDSFKVIAIICMSGLTPELSRPARCGTGRSETAKRARLERIVRPH